MDKITFVKMVEAAGADLIVEEFKGKYYLTIDTGENLVSFDKSDIGDLIDGLIVLRDD